MKHAARYLIPACLIGLAFTFAAPEQASATEPALYDWPDATAPVLVRNDSGIIFIGKEKSPFRAYSWKENRGERHQPLYLVDLTRNGTPEIVGAGTPTFVLRANSDPVWALEKGCRQVIVGDFVADKKLDIFCQNGRELKTYTDDGQFVWELSLGKNIDWCRAEDINGDLKADLECKYRGANDYARVDGSNANVIAQTSKETKIEDGALKLDEPEPVIASILEGNTLFDLNGDGNAQEGLIVDEGTLIIQSKTKGVAPVRIETRGTPIAALVKDLDGDKKLEIVALTRTHVHVISNGGADVETFNADAKRYQRHPLADLTAVHANGFEDDTRAREAIEGVQERLSQCYASQIRSNPYAGSGRLLLQAIVDGTGKATQVSQMHSDLGDKKVEQCARKIIEGLTFPNAASESGTVNVNMTYTFRDRER
ncbi:MAG: AgmX/PglI C-terminal domain-containing protein [Bradymonadaceae bacterium]